MKTKGIRFSNKYNSSGYLLFCMMMCISGFLTACGTVSSGGGNVSSENSALTDNNASTESDSANAAQEQEWVYVPERIVIEDERADYGGMQLVGDTVCYVSMNGEAENEAQSICQYSITDRELTHALIEWPMEEKNRDVVSYVFDQDRSVWLIVNAYPADYSRMSRFLCRFDPDGKSTLCQDITGQLEKGISISDMTIDSQGKIYIFTTEAGICLYGSDGSYHGSISYDSSEYVQVKGCVNGAGDRLYVCISKGKSPDYSALVEVDFEKKQLTELTGDFPNINGLCEDPAGQYDFLLYDNISVYGYDLSAQKNAPGEAGEELFVWGESDINGYFASNLCLLEDSRYFATVEDWMNGDRSIVLLDRTRAEEAPRRENVVLASVNGGSDLAAMAVGFNRSNDQYHITVKDYDSLTDLYNAILAKEDVDIIDLAGVNVENLSRQGVFEDLTPYVDQSIAFGSSDFLDGILDVYTFDGILVGIPESFTLRTVVGDRTRPGGSTGLTLDGLLAAAVKDSGAMPFGEITKEEMMQYIMMFNEDTFIDWNTGQCHFDSETFKAVLELVKRFPDEPENGQKEISLPARIQNGKVLYAIANLWGLDTFQLYQGMFGDDAACVGFPTRDGKEGTLLFPRNAFGITASSDNKSGAWEFIENALEPGELDRMEKEEVYNMYSSPTRFPALKKAWDIVLEYKIGYDSQYPSDVFPLQIYEDGWSFQYHAVTQEDADVILDLLREATPSFYVEDDAVINIINEEASGYYSGQKGIEDVIRVIQNRIQLYVSENS